MAYWKREFPQLRIQKQNADICGQCYIFAQSHKYGAKEKLNPYDSDHSDDGNDQEEPLETNEEMEAREQMILDAALHVNEAQAMRSMAQEKVKQAKTDRRDGVPRKDATVTLFADYAQSMELPMFGSEQPGETFYYSPLTINCFGIVDACAEDDHLHAYIRRV
jgi:hypothetical protein